MEKNIKIRLLEDVKNAINEKNINKAKVVLKGYLEFDSKDPEFSSILAKIYTQEGDFKTACQILKEQNPNYFCIFEELVQVYIKLQKYDKLYNLWKKSKDRNFQDITSKKQLAKANDYLRRTSVFLKSFMNKGIKIPPNLSYQEQQYLKYDYIKALEHIKERHTSFNNIPNENTISIFFNNYDIEELLLAASRNIEFEKREIKMNWDFSDTYIFFFKKIGRDENNTRTLNYFRIATIPNTNKIITMFPVFNRQSSSLCHISKEDRLSVCNSMVHTDKTYRLKYISKNCCNH